MRDAVGAAAAADRAASEEACGLCLACPPRAGGSLPAFSSVDGHIGARAHTQRVVRVRLAGDLDAHREALADFDPVAGGVLRRQHWENGARAGADALDDAV